MERGAGASTRRIFPCKSWIKLANMGALASIIKLTEPAATPSKSIFGNCREGPSDPAHEADALNLVYALRQRFIRELLTSQDGNPIDREQRFQSGTAETVLKRDLLHEVSPRIRAILGNRTRVQQARWADRPEALDSR
jgi:hypothetical protein